MRHYINLFEQTIPDHILQIISDYNIPGISEENMSMSEDGEVNIHADFHCHFQEIPFKLNIVSGNFYAGHDLKSLKNGPNVVFKNFGIGGLDSLKGAPKEIGGYMLANSGRYETLEGGPEIIGKTMYLDENYELKSLKGMPKVLEKISVTKCPELTPWEMRYILFSQFRSPEVIAHDDDDLVEFFQKFIAQSATEKEDNIMDALETLKGMTL